MKNYLKISRLLLIIGVVLFSAYLYYPVNKINEVKLGDINTSEIIDYPFEIVWEDKDYENNRPSSITYNLYNVLDENTIVSTVTLTPANVDANDSNKWNGVFNNVPNYNQDESYAEYIIKQQEINDYSQRYSKKDYDALCVEFGNNVFNGNNYSISFIYNRGYDHYYLINNENNSKYFYRDQLQNKTVCIPISTRKDQYQSEIQIRGSTANLDIKNIYPTVLRTNYSQVRYNNYYTSGGEYGHYGSFYPNIS